MQKGSLIFARAFGIPLGIHYSWPLIAALVAFSLAKGYFPTEYPGWSSELYWITAVITTIFFFASVVTHELGHSIVALREGLPVRSITLFIFGGLAQIGREPRTAAAELRIAAAGPVVSLGLAGLFRALSFLPAAPMLAASGTYLSRINLMLAVFNLLPGFPLDGGRILRAILWATTGNLRTATRQAATVGQVLAFGLIFLGVWQIFLGNPLNGLWIAFIGWFLNSAAESSLHQAALGQLLEGVKVRDLMTGECPVVDGTTSLEQFVDEHVLRAGRRCVLVTEDQSLRGMMTLHNIRTVPREHWSRRTVAEVMTPIEQLQRARLDEDVWSLLQRMDEADVHQMPVTDDGRLVGLITREHLIRYIRTRLELGI